MGQHLYIGSCAGTFYAIDAHNGELQWRYDVSTDGANQFHGNPLLVDSLIIIGTDEGSMETGSLYAFSSHTGSLVWKSTGHSGVASDAAFSGDSLVFVVTRDDSLLAVSIRDGRQVWSFSTGWEREDDREYGRRIEMPHVVSSPVVFENQVYIPGRDSTIYCLRSNDGSELWKLHFDGIVTSYPLITDSFLILGLDDFTMITLDMAEARIIRRDSVYFLPHDGMSVFDSTLFYLGGFEDARSRDIVAIDIRTCNQRWVQTLYDNDPAAYWYVPRIHLWDNMVVVGSSGGLVVAYNFQNGNEAWRYRLDNPIRGIGHSDSMLYVGTFDGVLYALSAAR